MSGWSKGPWRSGGSCRTGKHSHQPVVLATDPSDGDDLVIAGEPSIQSVHSRTSRSTAVANSHLMAAAPDLAEALLRLVNEALDNEGLVSPQTTARAQAAYAKAEGKGPQS